MLKPLSATAYNISIISPPVKHPKYCFDFVFSFHDRIAYFNWLRASLFLSPLPLLKKNDNFLKISNSEPGIFLIGLSEPVSLSF